MKRLISFFADLIGFGLIIAAAWVTNPALGLLVAGACVLVVNFWLSGRDE